ncbi:PIN domain-containing protein [Stenotrophomonas lactitubi]
MSQIQLFMDTNILHQETLTSARMKSLFRVIESNFVELFIPSIVAREYVTKIAHDGSAKLQSAAASLDAVVRAARVNKLADDLSRLSGEITTIQSEYVAACEEGFSSWARQYKVKILDFSPESITSVLNGYFSGASPFRAVKAREDLLDAMIGTSIEAHVSAGKDATVLIKDGVFKRHLSEVAGVQVFDSLGEFLDSPRLVAELRRLDAEANIPQLLVALSTPETKGLVQDYARSTQSVLDTIYAEDYMVAGVERLPVDGFGVRVNGPIVENVRSLEIDDVQYIGNQSFAYNFLMFARVGIDFCADYGDYVDFEGDPRMRLTSMNGSGVCDITSDGVARIDGKLLITMRGLSLDDLQHALGAAAGNVGQFEMEFEVRLAEVL